MLCTRNVSLKGGLGGFDQTSGNLLPYSLEHVHLFLPFDDFPGGDGLNGLLAELKGEREVVNALPCHTDQVRDRKV